jgi:hypothetical protein
LTSHSGDYTVDIWPVAQPNEGDAADCDAPIGPTLRANIDGLAEGDDEPAILTFEAAAAWRPEIQAEHFSVCGEVVRTNDDVEALTEGFPIEFQFAVHDPDITATLEPNALHVTAEFDWAGNVTLHQGPGCRTAAIESTVEGGVATWHVASPTIDGWLVCPAACVRLHAHRGVQLRAHLHGGRTRRRARWSIPKPD